LLLRLTDCAANRAGGRCAQGKQGWRLAARSQVHSSRRPIQPATGIPVQRLRFPRLRRCLTLSTALDRAVATMHSSRGCQMTELEAIEKLRSLLSGQPAGPVDDDSDVEGFLVTCWPVLKGGDGGGMDVSKLVGRIESLAWEPPHLTFKIERHGRFVMGSGRAEMQSWAVNVNSGVARFGDGGYRQMRPRDPALKTRPIA